MKNINKWFAYIGFPLIFIAAFRAIPHMLAGDPNAAKRASGDFLFPGLILIGIWFVLGMYYASKTDNKNERINDVPNMTKEEYIKKHSDGTHTSNVSMGDEWENIKKNN